jgi:DNA-binding NarL/FixJ family response regulator
LFSQAMTRPRGKEAGFSELLREWNRLLYEEGLGVLRGGREIPLPPEALERFRPLSFPRGKHPHIPLEILSEREREVVELLFFDGESERKAARMLGISRSTVRGYRREALKKLRERMGGKPPNLKDSV